MIVGSTGISSSETFHLNAARIFNPWKGGNCLCIITMKHGGFSTETGCCNPSNCPDLYLYFLYGSSSTFWTVKLGRKIRFPTYLREHRCYVLHSSVTLHILQSTVHWTSRNVTICANSTLSPMQNLNLYIKLQDSLNMIFASTYSKCCFIIWAY